MQTFRGMAPAKKTGKKTGTRTMRSPRSGAEIPTGAHPGNTGGKKGRSGRPSSQHREWCRKLIHSPAAEKALRTVLGDDGHKHFAALWKTLAERGYGKAHETIEVTGQSGGPVRHEVEVRFTKARS